MNEAQLNEALQPIIEKAKSLGYTIEAPSVFIDDIYGNKLAYYRHGVNKIVFHEDYATNGSEAEVMNTLIHELAHAVAEQNNKTEKRVWHGDFWKKINSELGGDSERFHKGSYHKPEAKKLSYKELYSIKPTHPADRWERGTYNQWLRRGYHVMKGQKGQLSVWEFSADEYETAEDGKTSTWGKASAVYFTPDQVEANNREGK